MFNPFAKITATVQAKNRDIRALFNWIRKRALFIIVAVVILFFASYFFYLLREHNLKYSPEKAIKAGAPLPVEIYQIRHEPITEIIGAVGEVRPFQEITLTTYLQIKIEKVYVDVGDIVKKDQLLIELDQTLLLPALKRAEERVRNAKAELDKLKKTIPTYHQELLSNLESAKAYVKAAESNLEKNQTNFDRIESLYGEGIVSKSDFDAAKSQFDQAQQNYSQAKETLLKSQNALDNEEVTINSWKTAAQYNYCEALENLTQAKYDLENSIIMSPVDGIVTERNANVGELIMRRIQEARILLTVAQIDPILVAGLVPQERINMIHINQKAQVKIDSEPDREFAGIVIKIEPTVEEESKTFAALIKVDNPNHRLKPGLSAFARFIKEHKTLAVPRIAVIDAAGEMVVVTVDKNNIAHIKKIRVGISDDKNYQVLSGLRPGDRVAIAGQMNIKEGDKVRILNQ
jgi:multidrug efflux pump subunit AcrA (membrane-fusion protein)